MPNDKNNHDEELFAKALKEIDKDTVIPMSQFVEFEPLFRKRTDNDKNIDYAELSTKFTHTVNCYKPIHVISDTDGTELLTLPPIYTRIKPITSQEGIAAFERFQSSFTADDGNPNSISAIQNAKAGFDLRNALMEDNREVIANINNKRKEFKAIHDHAIEQLTGKKPNPDESNNNNLEQTMRDDSDEPDFEFETMYIDK